MRARSGVTADRREGLRGRAGNDFACLDNLPQIEATSHCAEILWALTIWEVSFGIEHERSVWKGSD